MADKIQKNIDTKTLKFGKRTYFFDVKEASNGNKYVRVTESRFIKEGEPWRRNTITLFKDDAVEFLKMLKLCAEEL